MHSYPQTTSATNSNPQPTYPTNSNPQTTCEIIQSSKPNHFYAPDPLTHSPTFILAFVSAVPKTIRPTALGKVREGEWMRAVAKWREEGRVVSAVSKCEGQL